MTQEINIHRSVHHKHIVGFHGFFEDKDNVYILLELCRRRVRFCASSNYIVVGSQIVMYALNLYSGATSN